MDSAKRRWVWILRNALATAILIPTAGTAYLELSAYAQSGRALNAVNALYMKGIDTSSPTRHEVETLIGRTAEGVQPGQPQAVRGEVSVEGVFRTYVLHVK